MARLQPCALDEVPDDVRADLEDARNRQGFISNMRRTLARRPAILAAHNQLTWAVMMEGTIPLPVKSLVALVASVGTGCRHCQAHTAYRSSVLGVDPVKADAVWTFESSPLFTPLERAALRFARDASTTPNVVDDEQFTDLRKHFDEGEIVELLSVISLFAFNSRWNDTVATETEDGPLAFAAQHLTRWHVGPHAGS